MRDVDVNDVTSKVRDLCIETNYNLSPDMKECLNKAEKTYSVN